MHCLVNADIYLLISNQRTYFFDQRKHFLAEIDRLNKLYMKYRAKKYEWKARYEDNNSHYMATVGRLESEIINLRQIAYHPKNTSTTQTDVDYRLFNAMERDYDNVYS